MNPDNRFLFKKRFGQNFLNNNNYISLLVNSAHITPKDTVLEIGTGEGAVTTKLAEKANCVISFEIDRTLIPILVKKFKNTKNIKLYNENFLDIDLKTLNLEKYKVVASLPYNISKIIIRKLLENDNRPDELSLIIQKEVAEDYCSKPPNAKFLSNYLKIFGNCRYVKNVSKRNFYPAPKVDGAIININVNKKGKFIKKYKDFVKFIKLGYLHPRKKVISNLARINGIEKDKLKNLFKELGIKENSRAQEIKFYEWENLFKLYKTRSFASLRNTIL